MYCTKSTPKKVPPILETHSDCMYVCVSVCMKIIILYNNIIQVCVCQCACVAHNNKLLLSMHNNIIMCELPGGICEWKKMEESDVYNFMDGCELCTDLDVFVHWCPGIMLEQEQSCSVVYG